MLEEPLGEEVSYHEAKAHPELSGNEMFQDVVSNLHYIETAI